MTQRNLFELRLLNVVFALRPTMSPALRLTMTLALRLMEAFVVIRPTVIVGTVLRLTGAYDDGLRHAETAQRELMQILIQLNEQAIPAELRLKIAVVLILMEISSCFVETPGKAE